MKVDQMIKTNPADDDVWVLRNPSHYHRRMKQGNKTIFLFSKFEMLLIIISL
jgi:hypothetical protein